MSPLFLPPRSSLVFSTFPVCAPGIAAARAYFTLRTLSQNPFLSLFFPDLPTYLLFVVFPGALQPRDHGYSK